MLADDLPRALCGASAAGGAFGIVDDRKIADHMDRIRRAVLFAQLTANTANAAQLSCLRARLGRVAIHTVPRGYGNQLDQVLRADLRTRAASGAFFGIDLRRSVHHMQGIIPAYLHTAPEPHTTGRASLVTPVHTVGGNTVLSPFVMAFFLRVPASAGAQYACLHRRLRGDLHAHDLTDLLGTFLTARTAGIGGSRPLYDRFRQCAAPGIAAPAAIRPGKDLTDLPDPLIGLDREHLGCHCEDHTEQDPQPGENTDGDQNI